MDRNIVVCASELLLKLLSDSFLFSPITYANWQVSQKVPTTRKFPTFFL